MRHTILCEISVLLDSQQQSVHLIRLYMRGQVIKKYRRNKEGRKAEPFRQY